MDRPVMSPEAREAAYAYDWPGNVRELDRLLSTDPLFRTNGHQSQAAQLLGLSRPTLHAKIQRFGIESSNQ